MVCCLALLTTKFSWSQNAIITGYNCTSPGSANISISPTTGITSYSWRVAGTSTIIATTSTTVQPSGSYSITILKSGITSTLNITVAAGIVPTAPIVSPSTVSAAVCGSVTQTLTSTTLPNYAWKRDGMAIVGTTNSIIATGSDVSSPGNYNYTVTTTNPTTGCASTSNAVMLSMSPTLATPTISAANGNTLICGSSTQVLSASGGGASYVWRRGSTTLPNNGSNLTVTGTDATGAFVYTAALANSAGCPLNFSTGVSLILSPAIVTPNITLIAPVVNPICGTNMQVLTTTNVAGFTYFWKRDGVALSGSANNSITVTGTDVSTPGNYNYTVAAQNAVGCVSSDASPAVLRVSPKPATPTITPSDATTLLCGASTQTLNATPGGSSYTWKRGSTVLGNSTGSLAVAGNDATGTFFFTASQTNSVGCVSDESPTGVSLTLSPAIATPTITTPIITTPICGTATQIITASTGGTSYVWKRDGIVVTGSTNSIVVTGNDVATGVYKYTVSTQNSAGCVSAESTPYVLKVSPKPATPIITPNDATTLLCGASTQTLNATSGGSSYTWKRGSTVLGNNTGSLAVAGNDATGTFFFTASQTNSVGCVSDESSTGVSLTLSPATAAPTITTSPITTPICGTATQTLTASTGGTTYIWKRDGVIITGSTNSIIVTGTDVTALGSYSYTVATQNASGCTSAESAPYVLKVSPKPATPIITPTNFVSNIICGTDSKTLTATGGGTTYTWKRAGVAVTSPTTNIINVFGSDVTTGGTYIYTVSLTNSVGCISDDSPTGVTLQLFPTIPTKPTITASDAVTFCEGGSVTLNYTRGVTTDMKVWSRTSGADTTTTNSSGITVRSTNTFTLKTKDINGCTSLASNSFLVTVNSLPLKPIIDKGMADAVCESDSITLTSNNKGTGGYLWNNGRTTTSITVKAAGAYSLTYTDSNICTSLPSLPFVLTINPLPVKPTITNLNKSEFCFREFTTLRAASTTTGTTFEWDYFNRTGNQIDVSGSSKKTENEIIKISVRAVSAFSNSTVSKVCKSKELSDVATITIKPLPTTPSISTSGPIIFCPDSTVNLISTDSPNGIYKWINARNNLEISDKKTILIDTTSKNFNVTPLGKIGRFYVQTIGVNECKSDTSRNVIITVRNAPLKAVINPSPISATVCLGGKVTLKALFSNGNINRYSWRDEATKQEVSTEQEVSVIATGTYTVKVRDVFGCFADNSDPLKVNISPLPIKPSLLVVRPKMFCDEDSTTIQSSQPSTTPSGRNLYQWIVDGNTVLESNSRTFYWKKASSIAVAVTDSNGCKALASSDTIRTTVNPLPSSPTVTVRGAIPFCADKNVTLSAVGTPGVTYKWSTGAITSNITTNIQGNITVQAINGFGCLSKPSQPVQVRVYPLPITPKLTANGVTTFCDGSKVRIVSSSPFQAFWFRSTTDSIGKGEDMTSIFASKSGNYFAKVQDDNGCISSASTPIAVDSRPNPTPTVVKQIGTFSLDAQGVGDENGYIWRYNGDVQKDLITKIIKAKKDGDYQVQASITYTGVALAGGKLVCYSNTSNAIKYVQDLTFEGFSIFPNPTVNGEINVEVIEDLIGATVTVYNLYGQLVAEYKVDKFNVLQKIQLPDYQGNMYIIKVATDGFDRTRRVITLK